MKVSSFHPKVESEVLTGVTVVELDPTEAKRYKNSDSYKSHLKGIAENAMKTSKTCGIIIEEFHGCDFLDIFSYGEFST